jgi:hypothetical protein
VRARNVFQQRVFMEVDSWRVQFRIPRRSRESQSLENILQLKIAHNVVG